MESRRMMNQDLAFSSGEQLGNLLVTSNLMDLAWTEIAQHQGWGAAAAALPCSVQVTVSHLAPNRTVVAFLPPPDSNQHLLLPQARDLVPSPQFDFLGTKKCPSVSINRAALGLFAELSGRLDALTSELTAREGQLIITGHSLGGSVACLFTLHLLNSMDKKIKCRPICITFGSPLIGSFGLRHSVWNSFFFHVVSTKDPVPALFLPLPSGTTVYKSFGTYLFCSESGCACFDFPRLIKGLLTLISSGVAGGLQVVDYGDILRSLKNRAIRKGPPMMTRERFASPFSAGLVMELQTIGIDHTKLLQLDNGIILKMEEKAKSQAKKTKAADAKKLNRIKKDMAMLEWYKKKSKDTNKCYYDCFKNPGPARDIYIIRCTESLKVYWEDMVAEAMRKPQKEFGAALQTGWLLAGTTYRRMVEPLDIAEFYRDGGRDYMNTGRSDHYKLLQEWYERRPPPAAQQPGSNKPNVSVILTEDSCFWAHVEEAFLSTQSLRDAKSTPEQRESSWNDLVKFGEYVMGQIGDYAVSAEIFLWGTRFMEWWRLYEDYLVTTGNSHTSRFVDFMRRRKYKEYGRSEEALI